MENSPTDLETLLAILRAQDPQRLEALQAELATLAQRADSPEQMLALLQPLLDDAKAGGAAREARAAQVERDAQVEHDAQMESDGQIDRGAQSGAGVQAGSMQADREAAIAVLAPFMGPAIRRALGEGINSRVQRVDLWVRAAWDSSARQQLADQRRSADSGGNGAARRPRSRRPLAGLAALTLLLLLLVCGCGWAMPPPPACLPVWRRQPSSMSLCPVPPQYLRPRTPPRRSPRPPPPWRPARPRR